MSELQVNQIAVLESQLLDEYRRNGELREQLATALALVAKWEAMHGGKIDQVYSTAIDAGESFDLAETQRVTMRREP